MSLSSFLLGAAAGKSSSKGKAKVIDEGLDALFRTSVRGFVLLRLFLAVTNLVISRHLRRLPPSPDLQPHQLYNRLRLF